MPHKSSHRKRTGSKRRCRRQRQNQNQNQNQDQNNNQDPLMQRGGSNGDPQAPQISQETLQQAGKIAQQFLNNAMGSKAPAQVGGNAGQGSTEPVATEGLKTAMVEGAVAGANAGAIAAAEGYSSLKGAPLVGGKGRKGRQNSKNQNQNQNQKGGMVPGLMTAVETALVPLGLYLGQKALQSRRPGARSLGNSFDFRRSLRRTRRRR